MESAKNLNVLCLPSADGNNIFQIARRFKYKSN